MAFPFDSDYAVRERDPCLVKIIVKDVIDLSSIKGHLFYFRLIAHTDYFCSVSRQLKSNKYLGSYSSRA
jgi:hypothetical protein